MNSNLQQPPNWWHHSALAWTDLVTFFPIKGINDQLTEPSHWQRLSKGQSNHNYQFSFSQNYYFVQIVNEGNANLLPQGVKKPESVSIETSMLNFLFQQTSISPRLVECYVNTRLVRVFKWVQAEPISAYLFKKTTFDQQPLLSSIGDFVIDLHSIEVNSQQLKYLPYIEIEQYLDRYHRLAIIKTPQQSKKIKTLLQSALHLSQDFVASKICHNDLSFNNFLWDRSNTTLKVIDWEYACYSDPIMDLAGLMLNCQLNKTQQIDFIERYSKQLKVDVSASKLSDMKQLTQHISKLWQFASH